jgi:hypothetical protein
MEDKFFICKCGEEIVGGKDTDEHWVVCPKCKRRGQVILDPVEIEKEANKLDALFK